MTPLASSIRSNVAGHLPDMVRLLSALVLAESPSSDPATQAAPLRLLAQELEALGFCVERTPGQLTGGYLTARQAGAGGGGQLLLGHCDTVWPVGTLSEMPLVVEGDALRGPGSFDMKAGLVIGLFALRALRELGLEPPLAPVFFINTDEEIGSVESRAAIESLAQQVERALVLEPAAGTDGKLKTARKGIGGFDITVRGVAAHAGLEPEKGVSAILGMAELTRTLHGLTDLSRGLSVNVGVVRGGLRSNVVAPECRAEVDVRASTVADARRLEETILALPAPLPGTTLEISGGFERGPLERTPRNRALWALAEEAGRELGMALDETAVGGGSDGNLTSLHTATIDGLGPVGDGAHARHEFVVISSLVERSALLACLMMKA